MDADAIEFGTTVHTMGDHVSPESMKRTARAAEDAGFTSTWAGDHVVFPEHIPEEYPFSPDGTPPSFFGAEQPTYDTFQVLAGLAAVTDDLRVGTNTCIAPYRHPVDLIKRALTIDALSEGRFDFGVGVGWLRTEFEVLDVPYDERGGRTDEFFRLFERAREDGVIEFEGDYHSIQSTGFYPNAGAGRPPIYVGGRSGAALRRVAEFGDGWTTIWDRPAEIEGARERLRAAWSDYDREGEPEIVVTRPVHVGTDTDQDTSRPLVGEAASIRDDVEAYVEAGATRIVIDYYTLDADEQVEQIERFGDEVIPAFR